MRSRSVVTAAVIILSACSQNSSELEAAKKRISELESQLAAERAKNLTSPSTLTAASVSSPQAESAPSKSPSIESVRSTAGIELENHWNYVAREDTMTGGTTYTASVSSSNTVNFGFPYSGEQNAHLTLRSDPKYGKDIIFSIEKGQILCHSYEDCSVLIRFDDEKPRTFSGVGPADNSSETVFIRNYEGFITKLQRAKTVRISTNIYQQGAPVFEFDVSGFSKEKYKPKK